MLSYSSDVANLTFFEKDIYSSANSKCIIRDVDFLNRPEITKTIYHKTF